jgi:UDP-glucose 4-epimerase
MANKARNLFNPCQSQTFMSAQEFYAGKNVLVTGGKGFIGSNLSLKLVALGANVTILDSSIPNHGANDFNIAPIRDFVRLVDVDLRDYEKLSEVLRNKDVVFNLAGKCTHNSTDDLKSDVDINVQGSLNVLEGCLRFNPGARIVFPGSRMEYGAVAERNLPVKEDYDLGPRNFYGTHKMTAEKYHLLYSEKGLDTVVARITNPFGPRAQIKHAGYGVANWFVRQAVMGEEIRLFGGGTQQLDFIYINDVVNALLALGSQPLQHRVFNVGSGRPVALRDYAQNIIDIAGSGSIVEVPWPESHKASDVGNFYADITRIGEETGWSPESTLDAGLEETVKYYKENLRRYTE